MSPVRQGNIFPSTTVALILLFNLWYIHLLASSFQHSANMLKFICRLRQKLNGGSSWYYRVICLENGETPDWADMIHRYLSKLFLDLTHLWLNICYQTCVSFLLKLRTCFRDFDQVLLSLLLVNPLSREGNGNSFQYSCLENPTGGAWWAAVHGVSKSQTGLSVFTFPFHFHALE